MSSSASSGTNRRSCEELLAAVFARAEVGDWLLATSDSPQVTLAPTNLAQAMAVTYSAVTRPEASDWRGSLRRLYDSLVVPHHITRDLMLGSLFTDNKTADVFFPDSDVREATPLTRVAVNMRKGLEILHWIPLTNGQSIMSVSQFVEDVGFVVTRLLLDTDGSLGTPTAAHIVRWIRTVDTSNCLLCNTKGLLQCCCASGGDMAEPSGIVSELQSCNSWTRWVDNAERARNKLARTDVLVYSGSGAVVHRAALQTCMTVEHSSPQTHFASHQRFVSLFLSPNARSDIILAPRRNSNPLLGLLPAPQQQQQRVKPLLGQSEPRTLLMLCADDTGSSSPADDPGAMFDEICSDFGSNERCELGGTLRADGSGALRGDRAFIVELGPEPARSEDGEHQLASSKRSKLSSRKLNSTRRIGSKLLGGVQKEPHSLRKQELQLQLQQQQQLQLQQQDQQQLQQQWACEHCDAVFARKYDMKRHLNAKHVGTRQHKCEHCGMDFKHKWHLESHTKVVHERVLRFSCELCGKKFGSLSNKNEHLSVRHPSTSH